ncbi:MAG: DUF2877 domain-containing protein [Lonepinella koalarum]|nr:DUF2877 domain-containing protein [Lonepinella koalarum]
MMITEQTITIPLRQTSHYAFNFIGNDVNGEIHSVYNNTVNILINRQLFSLQVKNSPLSPISLITYLTSSELEKRLFSPKITYPFHFDYQQCDIFNEKLTALSINNTRQIAFYAQISEQILQQSTTNGLALLLKNNKNDLMLVSIHNYLTQIKSFYQLNDIQSAVKILLKLIGLGIGLTPSGDDFLCGFIAVFHRFNLTKTTFFQYLKQEIKQHIENTNQISGRFLDCALENRFSETLIAFFDLTERPINIDYWIKAFEKIGHSSGIDSLFGVYFACHLLISKKICDPSHICKN